MGVKSFPEVINAGGDDSGFVELKKSVTNVDAQLLVVNVSNALVGRGGMISQHDNGAVSPALLTFRKSTGTFNSPGPLGNFDQIGQINFQAYDGANYLDEGYVQLSAQGAATGGFYPTDFLFGTNNGTTGVNPQFRISALGNIVVGFSGILATTATDGFLYLTTCAGPPTGVPANYAGNVPVVVDTTNNLLKMCTNLPSGTWMNAANDFPPSLLAPGINEIVPPGYSAVLCRKLTIASGKKVKIGSAGILRIL